MDVRQATVRSRSRPLSASSSITASSVYQMHGGDIVLDDVTFPEVIGPGGIMEVNADVQNHAEIVDSLDDDYCGEIIDPNGGLRYQIQLITPGGQKDTRSQCLEAGATTWGPPEKQHDFSFQVPSEPGTYSFTIRMKMDAANDYDAEETQEFIFQVQEGAATRPDPGGNGGANLPWNKILLLGGGSLALVAGAVAFSATQ